MEISKEERAKIMREVEHKARRRAWGRVGFAWHLAVFLMANGAMLAINLTYTPDTKWFVWPLAAWGAGLFMHAFATFMGQGMTDDMIQAEVQREMARRGLT
jgi:hypothetical protein